MFEINDIVLHNQTEVCRVQDVREMSFLGAERIDYYVLKPVYEDSASNSTLYVPTTAGEDRLRRAFSAGELKQMLAEGGSRVQWIEAPLIRRKEYTDILNRSHPRELIGLIRILCEQRAQKICAGHKISEADEKYLASAQKRLYPLFRYILNVEWEDFLPMVSGTKETT